MTKYRVLEEGKNFSIVAIKPVTGRTNQIRIHFSDAGCPLAGERKYVVAKDYPLKFRRPALHAQALRWQDPYSGKKISLEIDLPEDMQKFIESALEKVKELKTHQGSKNFLIEIDGGVGLSNLKQIKDAGVQVRHD